MSLIVISRNKLMSGRNLVESTKMGSSKTDCRVEKKEKKGMRKEHKKEKNEKSIKHLSKVLYSKDGSDQLEKSGLSEELGEPQNCLGYLSDGSQNSKKRKRDVSPPPVESRIKAAPVAGNPLRIRLIFKKRKDECPSLPREDPLSVCSTSEPVVLSSVSCSKVPEPEGNLPSTSEAAVVETKKRKKHKPSEKDRYNALFDDWTPPLSICFDSSSDDDWLFGNRTQAKKLNIKAATETDEATNMCSDRPNDSPWPRARFLAEVGIYSLPYTVPF